MRYRVEQNVHGLYVIMDTHVGIALGEYLRPAEAQMAALTLEQTWNKLTRRAASYYHGPRRAGAGPTNREYWQLLDLEAQERELTLEREDRWDY